MAFSSMLCIFIVFNILVIIEKCLNFFLLNFWFNFEKNEKYLSILNFCITAMKNKFEIRPNLGFD